MKLTWFVFRKVDLNIILQAYQVHLEDTLARPL
ncbi:hypothetical protein Pla22_07570 [Rubripirellula amarantea]|uniref:Uncharacterized protein n=1 Tax=Rubripirellula amarantea TaxID=2527999 RepID=A0A5C5WSJ7_9BACT|nr:hypothetical protein Pla22_07570 [Rubripirellula amarantea]